MAGRPRVAVTLEQCWHRVPGGTAVAAMHASRAVARLHEVDQIGVAARHRHPPVPPWVPPIPVRMLPLPRRALYESWHQLRRPGVERATGPVDVIHATGMAVPPRTAPLVVTVHDLAFLDHPERATRRGMHFFRRAIDLARREADLVVAPSQATVDACIAQGFAADRIRLVPWGVESTPASDAAVVAVKDHFALRRPYVLWAGTIEPRENLPGLFDAFARLTHTDVDLVLAGPTGWNEDLERHLGKVDRNRVRALGFVDPDRLDALYAGAAVFCLPSLAEGFGLPVLEAMAQATPVVTSAGTATAEVVGDAGLTVAPRDAVGLAEAIDRVLAEPAFAQELAEQGQRRAATFTWARCADLLVAAYTEAIELAGRR